LRIQYPSGSRFKSFIPATIVTVTFDGSSSIVVQFSKNLRGGDTFYPANFRFNFGGSYYQSAGTIAMASDSQTLSVVADVNNGSPLNRGSYINSSGVADYQNIRVPNNPNYVVSL